MVLGCFSCIGGSSKSSKKKPNDESDTHTETAGLDSTNVEQGNAKKKGKAPMVEQPSASNVSDEKNKQNVDEASPSNKSDEKNKQNVDEASASNESDVENILNEEQRGVNQARAFTYEQLVNATENFRSRNILGEGGFGKVYRGRFEDSGQIVAIKQLDPTGEQGAREFVMEVKTLNRADHPHLVKLIGYCAEREHRLLVYEYMALGSLEDHLHGYRATRKGLDWNTRINIAAGAARGLEYLHDKMKPAVIYRDMKASNILLSEGYHAKLSDFGLARVGPVGGKNHVTTKVMGTYGYVSPDYAMTGKLTYKSDIYSFGVLLLELITGRKPHDLTKPELDQYLVSWARPFFKDKRKLGEMADPALKGEYPERVLYQAVTIAAMCVQEQANMRPLIADVVTAVNYLASKPYDPSTNPGQGSSSSGGQGSSSSGGQGSSASGVQGSSSFGVQGSSSSGAQGSSSSGVQGTSSSGVQGSSTSGVQGSSSSGVQGSSSSGVQGSSSAGGQGSSSSGVQGSSSSGGQVSVDGNGKKPEL